MNWIFKPQNWWKVFVLIFSVSVCVVGYIGYKTYEYAPPICDFEDEVGGIVFDAESIRQGQVLFFRYGLMEYGSFLGDGGLLGPDFTAEALHLTARSMRQTYVESERGTMSDALLEDVVTVRVQRELKHNRYDPERDVVTLNPAQAAAFATMCQFNAERFGDGGELAGLETFKPNGYISDPAEIRALSSFFFWGGWLCAAERPGYDYSFTHNWPYDPLAGNLPTAGVIFWSVIGALILVLAMGIVLYYYGKMNRDSFFEGSKAKLAPAATSEAIERFIPTPTQRACYKYFVAAALLFGVQVLAGLLTISEVLGIFDSLGINLRAILPVTVTRGWHTQISVLWIAVCWFAATIWVLPQLCRPEPSGQLAWVNGLFWLLVVVALGTAVGIPLGVHGLLGDMWRWLGLQGWEYMEMGRLYQYLLYAAFCIWLVVVVRGLWPVLRKWETWSLPNWIVYAIAGIIFMFSAGFVADPDTNFVIADFWRWCTIHMWVEAFFELFTTIIVAYFMYLMGFVSHKAAARVVYIGAILFLGSGLIGIAHNFYWNAKSIETVALGGVLSTLQIVPLILLTIEAWRFRNMPQSSVAKLRNAGGEKATFGLAEPFLFLIGVNVWNFIGAGVLGFTINLPIVNYYQHGTYLTVNHAHAALFGVYGNLAIGTMLFCGRWIIGPERWNARLLRTSFWSLNIGMTLMVLMDLFPVGVHQLFAVMEHGYAFARSQVYVQGTVFQTFTWLRGFGVAVFIFGGVLPLVWFIVRSAWGLKAPESADASNTPESLLVHS